MLDTKINLEFTRATAEYCKKLKSITDLYQDKSAKTRALVLKKQENVPKFLKSSAADTLFRDSALRDIFKGGCRSTSLCILSRGIVDLSRFYSTAEDKREQAKEFFGKKPSQLVRVALTLLTLDPKVILTADCT